MAVLENLSFELGIPGTPGAPFAWAITVNASVEEYAPYAAGSYLEAWESFEINWGAAGWSKLLVSTSAATFAAPELSSPAPTVDAFSFGWSVSTWLVALGATTAAPFGTALEPFESFALEWATAGWAAGLGSTGTASFDSTLEAWEDFEEEWLSAAWSASLGSTSAASFDGGAPESFEDFNEVWAPVLASADPNAATFVAPAHGIPNGTLVRFSTTGRAPAGISTELDYFVVNSLSGTFQVARTVGGSPVTFDDQGGGTHAWLVDPSRYWNTVLVE